MEKFTIVFHAVWLVAFLILFRVRPLKVQDLVVRGLMKDHLHLIPGGAASGDTDECPSDPPRRAA